MKKNLVFLSLFFFVFSFFDGKAQDGVKFEDLTYKEALAKAKAENKLLFMDCYTSWCGPCKKMLNTVFVTKEAGDFINSRFVSVKYDMEKGEGKALAEQFNIRSYPTFFIIRPDGTIQHKIGGAGPWKDFIVWLERGLDEKTSLDYLDKLYAQRKMTKQELLDYYWTLLFAGEKGKSKEILGQLTPQLNDSDKLKSDYWFLVSEAAYGSDDFKLVTANYSTFVKSVGKERVDGYLHKNYHKALDRVLLREEDQGMKEMQELAAQLKKDWTAMKWQPDMRLQNKSALLDACIAKNSSQIIKCLETGLDKQIPKWNYDLWVFLSTLDFVNADGKKAEQERLLALETKVGGYFANSESMMKRLAPYFEKFK